MAARRHAFADTSLRSFRATAEGHVYFLGEFAGERQLVRADQVALRILWEAPDRSLQTIVGRRHEKSLPTHIRYHIDHLSVVLENFGDRIRLGEGEEVRDVLHPAAARAPEFYDYRLVDSLEIRVHEGAYRVYRLQVRPSSPEAAGVVGTLYVERGTGALARMTVTFTSAAYVDPDLDYINVDLVSGLWEGRYWLPAEQEVEIRRQVSWLSFPVGGVIRIRFRVSGYRINEDGFQLLPGERVTALPAEELRAYSGWERPLDAGPATGDEHGERVMAEMRRKAEELMSPEALAGTARTQLHLPSGSGTLRARRAEGLLAGGGVRRRIGDGTASVWAGYAFGRERPELEASYAHRFGAVEVRATGFIDRLADIGPFDAASGMVATLGFLTEGEDYTDPFFEDGGEVRLSAELGGGRATAFLSFARQESAGRTADPPGDITARPVRPIEDGDLFEVGAAHRHRVGRAAGAAWSVEGRARAGLDGPGDFGFTRVSLELEARSQEAPGAAWGWGARVGAGISGGRLPAQRLLLLGGRGTVPGYPFRGWGGDRFALARAEVSRDLLHPWVRIRALGAAGWTDLTEVGREAAAGLAVTETGGFRPSAGVGFGLLYDIARVDLVRGLDGGDWEVIFSIDPDFWSVL